ncbi:hypothetical protein LTH96_02300 [Nesterenkonia sp. LB17]|uniref:hypothetical protein n=1 Tax=Nesterenkonia sp. LB17 TaxID=2901230 RepID=UPI001F4C87B9|nr:hypothetical protein [Nesterenkonia sp. LB17]MCH8564572.1 hypothetical protein [Nesterenkonia sp. LB17]
MTFFPSTRAAQRRRRPTVGAALGLLGVLLLTGCESSPAEQAGTPAAEPDTSTGGVQQQVPEPSGNQLSHEEMREQLESRYPDAALSDTSEYWAGLRDIETELQRLVVDPPECKQFVVRSAVPVPAGALVAYADETTESAEDRSDEQPEEPEDAQGDPEAGTFGDRARFQLASTEDDESGDDSADESESGEDADPEGDGASGDPGNGDSDDSDDSGDSENGGSEDEEEPEPEPVTVDLPGARQAVIYTFRDWRAADAYLAAEEDGLDSCDSYTASRGGEDSAETSTSVDTVDVSSTADAALGTTRRISAEGETEHNAAITLRGGSHIVTVAVPLEDALSEEEAEVAVEELQAEAADLLESLD